MNTLNTVSQFCRSFINRKSEIPVRSSDMGLLILISENRFLTSSKAGVFFGVSKPMIAAMVKRLAKEDYIVKESSDTDKRVQYLGLTTKGKKLVEESREIYNSFMKDLEEEMGHREFHNLIESIENANQAIRRMKKNG